MVKFLLDKGADLLRKDEQGNTAVHYCLFSKKINTEILHLFAKKGFYFGSTNLKNVRGCYNEIRYSTNLETENGAAKMLLVVL